MLIFLFLSCHFGRPTTSTTISDLQWEEQQGTSSQWKQQLYRSIESAARTENLQVSSEQKQIDIRAVDERLIQDDPQFGQIWSVTITIELEHGHSIMEEDRYIVPRQSSFQTIRNRDECYQRLLNRLAHRVILFYKSQGPK